MMTKDCMQHLIKSNSSVIREDEDILDLILMIFHWAKIGARNHG